MSRLQTGGFLNRYDLAYAVNQVGKIAPKMISQATCEINKIELQRIDQLLRSSGAEIERVAPKLSEAQSKKYAKHHSDFLEI